MTKLLNLGVEVTGQNNVQARLAALQNRLRDLSPFWRDVLAPMYFAQVQDLFETEGQSRKSRGRFGPGHWAALSPAYAAWKARHFPGKRILERTGALRDSLRWSGKGLGSGGIFESTPTQITMGTSVSYAGYHQRGTDKMPARQFLPKPVIADYAPRLKAWISGYDAGV